MLFRSANLDGLQKPVEPLLELTAILKMQLMLVTFSNAQIPNRKMVLDYFKTYGLVSLYFLKSQSNLAKLELLLQESFRIYFLS